MTGGEREELVSELVASRGSDTVLSDYDRVLSWLEGCDSDDVVLEVLRLEEKVESLQSHIDDLGYHRSVWS